MKLVCAQSDLSSKLSLLSRIVPNNPTHPVLANVLLTAEESRLGLSVFDLSIGMQVWIPALVEETGTLTLPARLFSDIVSKLPSQEIQVETDELAVTLACGTGRYQMQGLSADEFPTLPILEEVAPLQVDTTVIADGLQATLFASSSDESKQILTGLHINASQEGLEMATTDGHRLAIAQFPEEIVSEAINVTVPARALRELERMLSRTGAKIEVRSDASQIVFELLSEQGIERLSCRLLDGQYPAYNQLVPRSFERQMTVSRQAFLSAVDRIAVLAARKNNIIRLRLDKASQNLFLAAEAPEFGSGEESVPAQISGDSIEIAFNVKYLSDGLKAMDSTDIQMELNSETMPAILSPISGQKMTYLIMPIQVRN
ncbi:MAG: DNA polymerase III subunit beta [Thermosynechococcaceae cyanobacterium MS004]|nr:DNA polymerase III subunit beta [Thermosynechococcaceae cyanobacterium MS004]